MTDNTTGTAPTFWAAPDIAKAGYKVFPVEGKAPSVAGGFYAATTDPSQIAAWIEDGHGDHDIAVATGIVSDVVVVDADSPETYAEMEERYGPPTVKTKRGGHWWFRHPRKGKVSSTSIREHLDRKGDGGYVVVPPSRGRTWTEGIPEKDALSILPHEFRGEAKANTDGAPAEPVDVEGVLRGVPEGERDRTLFRASAKLRGAGVPYAFARRVILEAAAGCVPPFPEDEAIQKVDSAYSRYKPNAEFVIGEKKLSSDYKDEVAEERNLPFKTARQVAEETPAEVEWIARPWFARGCITEIDGKIKAGGKTTWVSHAAGRIAEGLPFMGEATTKTKILLLTEQTPASFRKVVERANLEEQVDVIVLHWHDTAGLEWSEIAQATTQKAFEIGAGLLIVDTLGQFAGIKGDGENNAGAAQEAMKPLQEAAARGLAIGITRHERKSGGEVGESGRGSSAFGGAVDIILSIRRAEGNTRPTVRVIESLSRFDETPDKLVIELTKDGYRSLGDASAFAEREAMSAIVDLLPTKEENAMPTADVLDRLKDQDIKRTVANEALVKLTNSATIMKIGQGKRGDPYRYYKPTPDGEKVSSENPRGRGTNNPGHPPATTETPDDTEDFLSSGTSTYIRKKEKTLLVDEDPGVDL